MQSLGNNTNISAIPSSYEKFMIINIGNVKFIDSMQFMKSSFETIAENLYDLSGQGPLEHVVRYDKEDKYKILSI